MGVLGKRMRRRPGRPKKRQRTGTYSRAVTRITRPLNDTLSCKRKMFIGTWTCTTAAGWNARAETFRLNTLPAYAEFTNLFEMYKINCVVLELHPAFTGQQDINSALGSVAGGGSFLETPTLYYYVDRDGGTAPATENDMMQYGQAKRVKNPLLVTKVVVRKPKVQFEVASGLGFSQAAPKSAWLDTENYAVDHWGVQLGVRVSGSAASVQYRLYATYYMQFKGTK